MSDCFARLGGDEFAILLPQSDLHSARLLAERVRRAVAALTFNGPQGVFALTVSIGVASLAENDASPEELLNRADRCLYAAKSEGRNRVRPEGDTDDCEREAPEL